MLLWEPVAVDRKFWAKMPIPDNARKAPVFATNPVLQSQVAAGAAPGASYRWRHKQAQN